MLLCRVITYYELQQYSSQQECCAAAQKNSLNRRRLASTPWSVNRSVSSIARLPGKPAIKKDAAPGSPPTAALSPWSPENIAACATHKYVMGSKKGKIEAAWVTFSQEGTAFVLRPTQFWVNNMNILCCNLVRHAEREQSNPRKATRGMLSFRSASLVHSGRLAKARCPQFFQVHRCLWENYLELETESKCSINSHRVPHVGQIIGPCFGM